MSSVAPSVDEARNLARSGDLDGALTMFESVLDKRKAAERLAEARDLGLAELVKALRDGAVEPKTALDVAVKLTELVETLEGRVARREEQRQTPYADLSDAELERAILREAESITRRAATPEG